MKKILILGGTGAMGKALVDFIHDFNIYISTRKDKVSSQNIKYIKGNAHDINFVKKIILDNNFDVIVDFMYYNYDEFYERVDLFLNNTKQYIFLSSARVYSNDDKTIDEKTKRILDVCEDKKYLNTHEYALEKAREEDLLISKEQKNWTIIRPYITYNDNRLQLGIYEKEKWLYRVIRGKTVAIQKKLLDSITTLTYAKDVSKYIAKIVLNEKAYGEAIQIANNMSDITWKDIADIYKKELYKKKIKMNLKVIETEKYDKLFNFFQLKYDRYCDRVFNSNKLEKIIDEKVTYVGIEDGLKECISKFFDNVDLDKIELDAKFNGIMDKITKEHTSLKEFNSFKEKLKYILARYTLFFEIKGQKY